MTSVEVLRMQLQISTVIFQAWTAVKMLLGDGYPERVEPYKKLVRNQMVESGNNPVVAFQEIIRQSLVKIDDFTQCLLAAAVVEVCREICEKPNELSAGLPVKPIYLMETASNARPN